MMHHNKLTFDVYVHFNFNFCLELDLLGQRKCNEAVGNISEIYNMYEQIMIYNVKYDISDIYHTY